MVLVTLYTVLFLSALLSLTAGRQLVASSISLQTTVTGMIFLCNVKVILVIQGQKFLTFICPVYLGFANPTFATDTLCFIFTSCCYMVDTKVGVTCSDRGCCSHSGLHFYGHPSHLAQQHCRLLCLLQIS